MSKGIGAGMDMSVILHGNMLATEHGHGMIPPHGGGLMPTALVKSTTVADRSSSGLLEVVVQLTTPMMARRTTHAEPSMTARILCLMAEW